MTPRLLLTAALALAGCPGGEACEVSPVASCPADDRPTYAEVEPILSAKCTDACHRPGGEEAKTLLNSYATAHVRANESRRQIESCEMPPSDEPQLTAGEQATLLAWIACGSPEK